MSFSFNLSAQQSFCNTPPGPNASGFRSSQLGGGSNPSCAYYLKVYVHVIRRTNGTGGQSPAEVNLAMSYLHADFNPHGIYFVWNGVIDYINNDSHYDNPSASIFNVNSHTDGIDIYLYNDHTTPSPNGNGLAQAIISTAFYVWGNYWNPPYGSLVKSHVISHEMGHCLGLWHTHHGSPCEGGSCIEFVNGTNCTSCGDFVCDSPADPCLSFNVNQTTCSWTGSGNDPNGQPYNPNTRLVMAYTHPDCMSYITEGQGERMRAIIATEASLQACLTTPPTATTTIINTNTTWSSSMHFNGNIEINSNVTLTINNGAKIRLSNNGKIIVKQNARLIVDNATIGSFCMWQGIEVWGNASQHQYVYGSNQLYQGFVELKNGAIIENASNAVTLSKAGDWQVLNSGGIIQAVNSTFKNNRRDVEFVKYQNFNPANPAQKRGNLSYFRNCKFETTANLNDGNNPLHHVTMWNVDGVRFYGCTFENSNTSATSLNNLGNGIYTEDAHFIVSGCDWFVACLPGVCCNYAPNIFRNLNYGIWTKRVSGVSYNYNIDKSNFINCLFSVNNEGVDNAIVTRNNLTIGKPRFPGWWTTGINFNVGTGYRIEENVITRDPAPTTTSIGTWMTNTGMNYNQVYKNSYTNVNIGNYAYQRNRGYDASTGLYSGLAFLCNTHTTIGSNDIYIYGTDPVNDGVRQYQGKLNSTNTNAINSAGNVFTRSGANSESDIANPNTPNITYFYTPPALSTNPEYPLYVTTNRVTRVSLTANTCPSTFSSGGSGKNSDIAELGINNGELTDDIRQQLLLDYQAYDQSLNQSRALYASLVDGGNTPQLKQTVESSWPSETWQLRQNLLGKSPYLSKEVLKESSDKTNVLPNAIIFEVLAANPDGLKDEELIKHLSEKANPLPAWMIELLRDGSGQTTPRTFLEAAISNTKAQRDQVITYLVHDMISKRGDNQEINHPQLRSWLAAYQTPYGDYQIVDDYFETGNYNEGLAILSTVPTIYKLNEKEQLEYNGLQSLFNVLAGVNTSGRNIFLLDESERSIIQDLADNGEGIAKVRACNLLGFVYGTECEYGLMLPDGAQSFKTDKAPKGRDNPLLPSINVFPNPAKDYVEFSYNLPSGAMEGTLTISDLKGVVIHKQQLSTKYGQIAIDTREWQQGTYLYSLSANGNSVANQKFVLIK